MNGPREKRWAAMNVYGYVCANCSADLCPDSSDSFPHALFLPGHSRSLSAASQP